MSQNRKPQIPAPFLLRAVASPDGFWLKDAEGRNLLAQSWDIAVRAGRPPLIRVNLVCGNFDIAGVPVYAVADPRDGKPKPVRRIVFFDGSAVDFPDLPATAALDANGLPIPTPTSPANGDSAMPSNPPAPVDGAPVPG